MEGDDVGLAGAWSGPVLVVRVVDPAVVVPAQRRCEVEVGVAPVGPGVKMMQVYCLALPYSMAWRLPCSTV